MSSRSRQVARTQEWVTGNSRQEQLDRESVVFGGAADEPSWSGRSASDDDYANGQLTGQNEQTGLFDEVFNRTLNPDDTQQWLKRFEKSADLRIRKTYERAKLTTVDLKAPEPKAGLVFLPGADKPTVTRLEEIGMVQKNPDQRNSTWRVNTAGGLLSLWTVDKDLSFVVQDKTRNLLDRMQKWIEEGDRITIDSEKVAVVHRLRDDGGKLQYDLCATLIEVDASSLIKLITHFKYLVKQSTPNMVPVHHVVHLRDMMEAARFFYTRCPILFRMGTRRQIIHANDIRYGIDDEQGFKTIYPSEGIQQLISVSAAYFNALDSAGANSRDKSHESVRSRFLQMLVLLLSMLGEANLRSMEAFLKETYKLRVSRTDIELLFLKTIPLASINSKVFLTSLVPAVFGESIPESVVHKEHVCWENFMQQLAVRGYLLPGSVEDLGHKRLSWLPKWPKEGIRSSHVFGRLQLHGNEPRGFNEILPIKVEADDNETEVMIYLARNDDPYIISVIDYEHVISLRPGIYVIRETKQGDRPVTLEIRAQSLSIHANKAIQLMNRVIDVINAQVRKPATGMLRLFNGTQQPPKMISGVLPAAEDITRHEVWLEGTSPYLAVAWKADGRTISKTEMLARMARDANRIMAVVNHFNRVTNGKFGKHDESYRNVQTCLASHAAVADRERNTNANFNQRITDTPIRRSVFPGDSERGPDLSIWYEYEVEFEVSAMRLFVFSQRDIVTDVNWLSTTQAEVTLQSIGAKFVVATIKPELQIPPDEEIQMDDIVLLCGKYLVVLMPTENNPPIMWADQPTFEMTNWLEIHSVSQETQRRRRKNQERHEKTLTVIV